MEKFEDSSTTCASSPSTSQKSTPSRPSGLWIEYAPCGCKYEFIWKLWGLTHWWKYTKLRYYLRWFSHESYIFRNEVPRMSTTIEEDEHWFGERNGR